MRPLARRVLLLTAVLALTSACTTEEISPAPTTTTGGAGGAGGAPVDPFDRFEAEYCRPLAELLCARAEGCACDAVPGWYAGEEACIQASLRTCLSPPGDTVALIEHGAYVFRYDLAAACVDVLRGETVACDTRLNLIPSSCQRIIASTTPIGATCGYPICAGGDGYCSPQSARCEPIPAAAGAACNALCAGDLVCAAGTCQPIPTRGGACGAVPCAGLDVCHQGVCRPLSAQGEACSDTLPCGPRLRCEGQVCVEQAPTCALDPTVCGNGTTCLSRTETRCRSGAVGDACTWDADCPADTLCLGGACAVLPAAGAPCAQGARCAAGIGCDPATTLCGPLPEKGAPCAGVAGGAVGCAAGLACVAGACGTPPAAGEACADDFTCGAGLGCEPRSDGNFCVTLRAAGGPCTDHRVCGAGLRCDPSTAACAPYAAAGEACTDSVACGPSGACLPAASGEAWVCGALPAAGEACYQNCPASSPSCHDCATGLLCAPETTPGPCAAQICTALLPG